MRVLIGCESSGAIRRAMRALGHDAWSCDLLPADDGSPFHLHGDVLDVLDGEAGWELGIFHPPCTYLANSGVRWLHTDPDRWQQMIAGAEFFRAVAAAPIPRVAVENPIMHKYAADAVGLWPDQVIQPWMFGHPETKATALWLRGLPPLVVTDDVREIMATLPKRDQHRNHYASPGPDRWKLRSATLPGVAEAMALQWAGDNRSAVA